MGRTIRFEPRRQKLSRRAADMRALFDEIQILVLRWPAAASAVIAFIHELVTEIDAQD